jgi:hypothetical protein
MLMYYMIVIFFGSESNSTLLVFFPRLLSQFTHFFGACSFDHLGMFVSLTFLSIYFLFLSLTEVFYFCILIFLTGSKRRMV